MAFQNSASCLKEQDNTPDTVAISVVFHPIDLKSTYTYPIQDNKTIQGESFRHQDDMNDTKSHLDPTL